MGNEESLHEEHDIKHSPAGGGRGAMWLSQGRKMKTKSETAVLDVARDSVFWSHFCQWWALFRQVTFLSELLPFFVK